MHTKYEVLQLHGFPRCSAEFYVLEVDTINTCNPLSTAVASRYHSVSS